jgi:hypothetical protein
MGDVDVVLRKFDGRPRRRTTTQHLGEDESGMWLASRYRTWLERL